MLTKNLNSPVDYLQKKLSFTFNIHRESKAENGLTNKEMKNTK